MVGDDRADRAVKIGALMVACGFRPGAPLGRPPEGVAAEAAREIGGDYGRTGFGISQRQGITFS